ncbi:MAG: ATP-dependent DNA ligase [Steroidobacteraceae bacterium]
MRRFATLFDELDTTTATNLKVDALRRYFAAAPPADAAWAAYILSGRKLKRVVGPALIRGWLTESSGLPAWLVDETYESVGDLAETVALLVPTPGAVASEDLSLTTWIEDRLLPLRNASAEHQRECITGWWRTLPYLECFLLTKLLTGALRVGVSELLVVRALAELTGHTRPQVTRALMGEWVPGEAFWTAMTSAVPMAHDPSQPYPFFLASPIEGEPAALGPVEQFIAEWKWDGIRAQLVRRDGQTFLWSRGAELITERFPEIVSASQVLPDGTVLDGELVHWEGERVGTFAQLQQRIGRKKLGPTMLARVPIRFLAYDLLEDDAEDLRGLPIEQRRSRLAGRLEMLDTRRFSLSQTIAAKSWDDLRDQRDLAREAGVEGLMLKRRDSPYGTGRERGAWWKWKVDPWTFDGVLIYAQPGHGRRSNLYTDYTFGVWQDGTLLPVAKAYSGLTNEEISVLDRWIRSHTIEKFGPVRSVEPLLVFELAFEGIARSPRHKSGIAMRFPRIVRQRTDKPAQEADTLANLQQLLDDR